MICQLHNGEAELCDSHIIPKFVYRWMKKSGTGRLRQIKKLNTPIQDGIKTKMLCKNCEDKFSIAEKWFNENVFTPYLENKDYIVQNNPQLLYFTVSILWRILKLFKDDGNTYKYKDTLDSAEVEWRNFLIKNQALKGFKNLNIVLIDTDYWITEKSDLYYSRAVDIEIAESDEICFVYAKFSRFILIGEITGFSGKEFENTNLATEPDFSSSNQMINHQEIFDFFRSRIDNIKGYDDLSQEQQRKNDKFHGTKNNNLENSDYKRIINKYR